MKYHVYAMPYMNSNMYVFADDSEAIIVDPQSSQRALEYLHSLHVTKVIVFLTHEHFDHTSGVNFLRENFPDVKVIATRCCAEHIFKAANNRPLALLKMVTEDNRKTIIAAYNSYKVEGILVDVPIERNTQFSVGKHSIECKLAPGHSPGSMLVVLDGRYVFSGDYLIPYTAVILRYPGGSQQDYREKTLPILKELSKDSVILPGHGESYKYADSKRIRIEIID